MPSKISVENKQKKKNNAKEKLATEADYSQYLLHLFPLSGVLVSLFFFIFIAFCFLHKMVASCFRFKLKWRPRLLAAAIRELCAAQLTPSHLPTIASPFLFPSFSLSPWLTCYSNMLYVLLQSTEIDFCVFSALRFVKNQSLQLLLFSGFMCCDFFFPQLLKPSNSLF